MESELSPRLAKAEKRLAHDGGRLVVIVLAILSLCQGVLAQGSRFAVRFHGTGSAQKDRVKIPLASAPALNVGSNFTFAFWMRAAYSNNTGTVATGQNGDGWITGNVILDRDVYGGGDYGDFGLAVGRSAGKLVLAFGAHNGASGQTIVGTNNVGDNAWHHVAITRVQSSRLMRIYVDGVLDASGTGPGGNLSYRVGRPTSWPNSDPFLVLGAEKHDAGSEYPSFNGHFDELTVWSRALSAAELASVANRILPPSAQTGLVASFRLEEGSGTVVRDAASGYAGTLAAGLPGNGTWTGASAGEPTAPILPFNPTIAVQAGPGNTLELSWFVPSNYRFEIQTTSNLTDAASWTSHPVWTNMVATETDVTATAPMSETRQFFRVQGEPYR